ncbi:MAG TPA: histidine phosphatase family protein [Ktedonobacteraceae bacterium]
MNGEQSLFDAADGAPFLPLKDGSTELYLIRHADAYPDEADVVAGGYDAQPLSSLGRCQARALAERLQVRELAAIYSSPIRRAWQTAMCLGEALGLPVQERDTLRDVGLLPGPSYSEAGEALECVRAMRAHNWSAEAAVMRAGNWSLVRGCEPSEQLRSRMTRTISDIVRLHAGQRVAIVTHSGPINAFLAATLGLACDVFCLFDNTALSVLRVKGSDHFFLQLNDTAHLYQRCTKAMEQRTNAYAEERL